MPSVSDPSLPILLGAVVVAVAVALAACKPAKVSRQAPEAPSASSAFAAVPPHPAKTVTLTRRTPAPGSKARRKRDLGFQLSRGGDVMRHTAHDVVKYEVKQSDASRIIQAGLDIEELYEANQQGDDAEEKTVNPLAGRRFTVARAADGRLSALDSAGAEASDEQIALLEQHCGELFKVDAIGAFVPARPLAIGENLKPTRVALLEMMQIDDDDDTVIDGVAFTLANSKKDEAEFDVGMTMTWAMGGGFRMRARLAGVVSLETATARLRALELAGPVVVLDVKGAEVGSGQFKAHVEVSAETS